MHWYQVACERDAERQIYSQFSLQFPIEFNAHKHQIELCALYPHKTYDYYFVSNTHTLSQA